MDKAQEQSKQTGLPILVRFTGTSGCGYCVKLESAVFSKSEFKSFADQNLVLLKLEYGPRGTAGNKKDELLSKEFRPNGFPSYFLTDSAGTRNARNGYRDGISPASFAEWVAHTKRPSQGVK
jgi:thioredoxin-related protein